MPTLFFFMSQLVLKSPQNSILRLYKQSPPARTLTKNYVFNLRRQVFFCIAAISNRQLHLELNLPGVLKPQE